MRARVIPHPGVNPTMRAALPGRPVRPPRVRPLPLAAHVAVPVARPPGARTGPVAAPPRPERPPLVTRLAPPPQRVPFTRVLPAMESHPGRPLEPVQLENLRAGRPAGPMLDREFPPHFPPLRPGRIPHRH